MTSTHWICPRCEKPALKLYASIELSPDASSDEITLQVLECEKCSANGLGVYEESRRGASEVWFHSYYGCDRIFASEIANRIRMCPTPRLSGCDCATHRVLGAQSSGGVWLRLTNVGEGLTAGSAMRRDAG